MHSFGLFQGLALCFAVGLALGSTACKLNERHWKLDQLQVEVLAGESGLAPQRELVEKELLAALKSEGHLLPPKSPAFAKRATGEGLSLRVTVTGPRVATPKPGEAPVGQALELEVLLSLSRKGEFGKFEAAGLGSAVPEPAKGGREAALREALAEAFSLALGSQVLMLEATAKEEPTLIADLHAEDFRLRDFALRELTERGAKGAVRAILPLLNDPERVIRLRAIGALERLGDARQVPALIEAVSPYDPPLAISAVNAVGALGGREAEAYLSTLSMGHPNIAIQEAAGRALEALEKRSALSAERPRLSK